MLQDMELLYTGETGLVLMYRVPPACKVKEGALQIERARGSGVGEKDKLGDMLEDKELARMALAGPASLMTAMRSLLEKSAKKTKYKNGPDEYISKEESRTRS